MQQLLDRCLETNLVALLVRCNDTGDVRDWTGHHGRQTSQTQFPSHPPDRGGWGRTGVLFLRPRCQCRSYMKQGGCKRNFAAHHHCHARWQRKVFGAVGSVQRQERLTHGGIRGVGSGDDVFHLRRDQNGGHDTGRRRGDNVGQRHGRRTQGRCHCIFDDGGGSEGQEQGPTTTVDGAKCGGEGRRAHAQSFRRHPEWVVECNVATHGKTNRGGVLELFLHEGREGLVNPTSGGGASEGVAVLTDVGCQDCVRGKGAWHR